MRDLHPLQHLDGEPKQASRNWMVNICRSLGIEKLPEGLQYWSLAGDLTRAGVLMEGSEPHQMTKSGLIAPSQYVGVERDPEVHSRNLAQKAYMVEEGEIEHVMERYHTRGVFNPGIINLDTIHEPRRAVSLLSRVAKVVRKVPPSPMVIFLNVVMHRYRTYEDDQVTHWISRTHELVGNVFRAGMLTSGWALLAPTYEYNGANENSRSMMKVYCLSRGYPSSLETRIIRLHAEKVH